MNSRWKHYLLYASLIIIGGGLIYILVETVKAKNTGFETKTLWNWMELLIIPLVLAIGAFYLNRSEHAVERQTAEDRTKLEREIATDRQQEAALQSYLDRMSDLLFKERLREPENKEARDVARIRTLTVLRGLDARRKGLVIIFLHEAKLINNEETIVSLMDSDLSCAELKDAYLGGANLEGAILNNANLEGAILNSTNLKFAFLERANLRNANLSGANLQLAKLKDANLQKAILIDAYLGGANLLNANFEDVRLGRTNMEGTTMPNGSMGAGIYP